MDRLFPFRSPRDDASARLVCFPFAGGGAATFRGWANELPGDIEVCAVELPGRGTRLGESPLASMTELVDAIHPVVARLLDRPTVLFGHSLGALVAFELARRDPRIGMLIASGARPPHVPPRRRRAPLETSDLVAELARLGGTASAIIEEEEMLSLFLPTIRADLHIAESYAVDPSTALECKVAVLSSCDDDEVLLEEPESSVWLKLHNLILGPLVPEQLL